uniref:Putative LOC102224454 [Xiphosphorus maculatus] n=1 Tax=Lepeophtheirus salmonis TaxID=72036 RepID=A0A0K2U9U2_LEPSM
MSSFACMKRLFSVGSDILRPKTFSLIFHNFENLVFMRGNLDLLLKKEEL